MTSDVVFSPDYARSYDDVYSDKDYGRECDLLERQFQLHGRHTVKRVLDLGCGTGRHACVLAQRGYEVTGVDRSWDMLHAAERRASAEGSGASFVLGDIRSVELVNGFDAAIMMFAVANYLTAADDLDATLCNARRHLIEGGVLVFDGWYAPAVLAQGPGERWTVHRTAEGLIVRFASGRLSDRVGLSVVEIDIWSLTPGTPTVHHTRERHEMRAFMMPELTSALARAGFVMVQFVAFPAVDHEPDESTWSVLVTAIAE